MYRQKCWKRIEATTENNDEALGFEVFFFFALFIRVLCNVICCIRNVVGIYVYAENRRM